MAIKKSLEGTPAGKPSTIAEPPERDSLFVGVLAEHWQAEYEAMRAAEFGTEVGEDKPTAAPCRIRHSSAGSCSRAISYQLLGERSDELTVADHYRFRLGQMVHDEWQAVAMKLWPDAEVEHVVTYGTPDAEGRYLSAGAGDFLVTVVVPESDTEYPKHQKRYHLELKTINGFGFKRSVGDRSAAEGPRHSAKLQGALNAFLADADELVIAYLAMENIAPKAGDEPWRRFAAEWRYPRAVFEPWAIAELGRFHEIVLLADEGILAERRIPDPKIPDDALITNPRKGEWQVKEDGQIFDAGTTWHCNYCAFQTQCVGDLARDKAGA